MTQEEIANEKARKASSDYEVAIKQLRRIERAIRILNIIAFISIITCLLTLVYGLFDTL